MQDLCTLEGLSDGSLPSGVARAGYKPVDTCYANEDCSTGFKCNLADNKNLCTCDSATGADTCKPLGACVMEPCKKCELCVNDMSIFPSIVNDMTSPADVADALNKHCLKTKRPSVVCSSAAAIIGASVRGNKGRRVGRICLALGECETRWVEGC